MAIYQRKGSLSQDQGGQNVLVNDKGQRLPADPVVLALWNACNGSVDSTGIMQLIARQSGIDPQQATEILDGMLKELEDFGFLQKVD